MVFSIPLAQLRLYDESPNAGKNTHTHEGYKEAFKYAQTFLPDRGQFDSLIVDLFARKCPWGTVRNDLNPRFLKKGFTNMNKDAIECLNTFERGEVDMILLDPPFSDRMNKDKYDSSEVGRKSLYTDPKYMVDLGKEINRVLDVGGMIVKAGFNSNKPCQGVIMKGLFLSRYGASRNDVIFTIWQKTQHTLDI